MLLKLFYSSPRGNLINWRLMSGLAFIPAVGLGARTKIFTIQKAPNVEAPMICRLSCDVFRNCLVSLRCQRYNKAEIAFWLAIIANKSVVPAHNLIVKLLKPHFTWVVELILEQFRHNTLEMFWGCEQSLSRWRVWFLVAPLTPIIECKCEDNWADKQTLRMIWNWQIEILLKVVKLHKQSINFMLILSLTRCKLVHVDTHRIDHLLDSLALLEGKFATLWVEEIFDGVAVGIVEGQEWQSRLVWLGNSVSPSINVSDSVGMFSSDNWKDWTNPHVDSSHSIHFWIDNSAHDSKRILIDGDDLFVEDERFDFRFYRAKISRKQKWSSKHRPNGQLNFALIVGQPKVAKQKCVRIVPMSGTREWNQTILVVDVVVHNHRNWRPTVVDVNIVAPQITILNENVVVTLIESNNWEISRVVLSLWLTSIVGRR